MIQRYFVYAKTRFLKNSYTSTYSIRNLSIDSDNYENKSINNSSKKWREISIDCSDAPSLKQTIRNWEASAINNPVNPSLSSNIKRIEKEIESPLAKYLKSYIQMKGPISIHDYMSNCLNHPIYGYYQNKDPHKIGNQGDFITAPEISQLFGEMIAIWLISTWQSMGSPSKLDIIELGPGNGTLMHDILHVADRFPTFKKAISIHLIELSEGMRSKQRNLLECKAVDISSTGNAQITYKTKNDINISWHNFLDEITSENPCLIIGQEFLDAFPVHQFIYTPDGWREKLVDIDNEYSSTTENPNPSKYHFRIVTSPSATPATRIILGRDNLKNKNILSMSKEKNPQELIGLLDRENLKRNIEVIEGKSTTQDSQHITDSNNGDSSETSLLSSGDEIEICPLALATCEDIAIRVNKFGGAALIIDYGVNFTQGDSLRAFKRHQQVCVLLRF